MNASKKFQKEVVAKMSAFEKETLKRGHTASNYLRNSSLKVLSGKRTGKVYRKPNTLKATYRASAPGEAPSSGRTGNFRKSWKANTDVQKYGLRYYVSSRVESDMVTDRGGYLLGDLLENGTSKMAPRPYKEAVIKGAEAQIKALFDKPYNI